MQRQTLQRCLREYDRACRRHYAVEATQAMGQPTYETHPHLVASPDFLTPGILHSEYDRRRRNLMDRLPENAVVLCCGSRLQYMAQSILCGALRTPSYR
jgi:hypothetical protein